jgi:hypothetical protein
MHRKGCRNLFLLNLRVIEPCSLVEVYRRFIGACCLNHHTFETSVNVYQTTRRNPEDSHLHTRRHENLKSHSFFTVSSLYVSLFFNNKASLPYFKAALHKRFYSDYLLSIEFTRSRYTPTVLQDQSNRPS